MVEYTEDTVLYLLMTENKKFVGIIDFATNKKFNFGFTSINKAKEFLQICRKNNQLKNIRMVYRCTLGEYSQLQEKDPKFPYVAIDTDPEQLSSYPLIIGDASKENIRVLRLDKPNGKIYSIMTSPKQ